MRNEAATAYRPAGAGMPDYVPPLADPAVHGDGETFLYHPPSHPLSFRTRRVPWWRRPAPDAPANLGIVFRSDRYVAAGSILEIEIPLRGQSQQFRGEVVLVRELSDGFEVGLWLESDADARRARIVEQVCHIESYLKQKRLRDGPFLSHESAAQEWVARYAHQIPV